MANKKISLLGTFIWLIAAVFFLYEFFLRTFIGSVAHQVIHDLHLNLDEFALLGGAYSLAYGTMQIPVGLLVDRFGVKTIMVIATFLCAASTLLFACSDTFLPAVVARFLMGFSSSFSFVCLLVIVANWFPTKYFAFFIGASQLIGTMGPVLAGGPLIEWIVHQHETWQTALMGIASIGLVLCVLSFLFVRTKPKPRSKAVFILRQEPFKSRLLSLLKTPQAWFIAIYSSSIYVSISLMGAFWGTTYLEARGFSQITGASIISITWISYALACPIIGYLSDLTQRRKPWLILCALVGVLSTVLLVWLPSESNDIYAILFAGLGIAASGQNLGFAMITEQTHPSVRATAIGLNNGLMSLGIASFLFVVSDLIKHESKTSAISLHGFEIGLSAMPVIYIVSLAICLFCIHETHAKQQ